MSIRPSLSIHHAIPGRLRLGIEPLRGKPAEADRIAEAVRALPGIRGARANATAATLVIEHDPAIPHVDLLARLGGVVDLFRWGVHEMPYEPPSSPAPVDWRAPPRAALAVLHAAARANSASRDLAEGHVDLKLAIPGALAGFGLYRLLTGRSAVMPHGIVFLMYGLDAFALLNQGMIKRFLEPSPAAASRA
jgi:hypothetical protein